jgi:hypothetical protein
MSRVRDLDREAREQVIDRIAASLAGRTDLAFATVFGSCESPTSAVNSFPG